MSIKVVNRNRHFSLLDTGRSWFMITLLVIMKACSARTKHGLSWSEVVNRPYGENVIADK